MKNLLRNGVRKLEEREWINYDRIQKIYRSVDYAGEMLEQFSAIHEYATPIDVLFASSDYERNWTENTVQYDVFMKRLDAFVDEHKDEIDEDISYAITYGKLMLNICRLGFLETNEEIDKFVKILLSKSNTLDNDVFYVLGALVNVRKARLEKLQKSIDKKFLVDYIFARKIDKELKANSFYFLELGNYSMRKYSFQSMQDFDYAHQTPVDILVVLKSTLKISKKECGEYFKALSFITKIGKNVKLDIKDVLIFNDNFELAMWNFSYLYKANRWVIDTYRYNSEKQENAMQEAVEELCYQCQNLFIGKSFGEYFEKIVSLYSDIPIIDKYGVNHYLIRDRFIDIPTNLSEIFPNITFEDIKIVKHTVVKYLDEPENNKCTTLLQEALKVIKDTKSEGLLYYCYSNDIYGYFFMSCLYDVLPLKLKEQVVEDVLKTHEYGDFCSSSFHLNVSLKRVTESKEAIPWTLLRLALEDEEINTDLKYKICDNHYFIDKAFDYYDSIRCKDLQDEFEKMPLYFLKDIYKHLLNNVEISLMSFKSKTEDDDKNYTTSRIAKKFLTIIPWIMPEFADEMFMPNITEILNFLTYQGHIHYFEVFVYKTTKIRNFLNLSEDDYEEFALLLAENKVPFLENNYWTKDYLIEMAIEYKDLFQEKPEIKELIFFNEMKAKILNNKMEMHRFFKDILKFSEKNKKHLYDIYVNYFAEQRGYYHICDDIEKNPEYLENGLKLLEDVVRERVVLKGQK